MIPRCFLATFLILASFTAPAEDGMTSHSNGKDFTDGEVMPFREVSLSETAMKAVCLETSHPQGLRKPSPSRNAK